jgi:hypothetical protein
VHFIIFFLSTRQYANQYREGDALQALKDAETAVSLDPSYHRAHFRRIKALRKLEQHYSVSVALDQFQRDFPGVREFDAEIGKVRRENKRRGEHFRT